MSRNPFNILAIFIIGTVGGIFADQILWPYFIERPLFYEYKLQQNPVYVNETKEITNYVQENVALRQAVEKVAKTVIGVKATAQQGSILRGSGLVATRDGFLITLAELVPQGSEFAFFIEGQWPDYEILKRDTKNNLALVKVDGAGFSTAGFADSEEIRMGERVFLLAFDSNPTAPRLMVNEGIIKSFDKDIIQTSIAETVAINGSPLFDIEGRVVGLSFVNASGQVSAISVSKIRQFSGL